MASRAAALAFRPRATDVLIATFPKCGTPGCNRSCTGSGPGGPWTSTRSPGWRPGSSWRWTLGIDPDAPQVAEPGPSRATLSWHEIPKGGRYLSMVRDPKDVLVSMYHFHEGWRFEPGTITLGDYARKFFLAPERARRYWRHCGVVVGRSAGAEDVLMLGYEAALGDVPGTVEAHCPLHRVSAGRRPAGGGGPAVFHRVHEGPRLAVRRPPGALRAQRRPRPSAGGSSSKVRGGRVGDHVYELPWTYARPWTGSGVKRWSALRPCFVPGHARRHRTCLRLSRGRRQIP